MKAPQSVKLIRIQIRLHAYACSPQPQYLENFHRHPQAALKMEPEQVDEAFRLERLTYELDDLVDHYLDENDKMNLSYYLNEFETKSCDLSDLLTNLLDNLLRKMPNPKIKYKLLILIRQIYIEPNVSQKTERRPTLTATKFERRQVNRTGGELEGRNRLPGASSSRTAGFHVDLCLLDAMTRRYLIASRVEGHCWSPSMTSAVPAPQMAQSLCSPPSPPPYHADEGSSSVQVHIGHNGAMNATRTLRWDQPASGKVRSLSTLQVGPSAVHDWRSPLATEETATAFHLSESNSNNHYHNTSRTKSAARQQSASEILTSLDRLSSPKHQSSAFDACNESGHKQATNLRALEISRPDAADREILFHSKELDSQNQQTAEPLRLLMDTNDIRAANSHLGNIDDSQPAGFQFIERHLETFGAPGDAADPSELTQQQYQQRRPRRNDDDHYGFFGGTRASIHLADRFTAQSSSGEPRDSFSHHFTDQCHNPQQRQQQQQQQLEASQRPQFYQLPPYRLPEPVSVRRSSVWQQCCAPQLSLPNLVSGSLDDHRRHNNRPAHSLHYNFRPVSPPGNVKSILWAEGERSVTADGRGSLDSMDYSQVTPNAGNERDDPGSNPLSPNGLGAVYQAGDGSRGRIVPSWGADGNFHHLLDPAMRPPPLSAAIMGPRCAPDPGGPPSYMSVSPPWSAPMDLNAGPPPPPANYTVITATTTTPQADHNSPYLYDGSGTNIGAARYNNADLATSSPDCCEGGEIDYIGDLAHFSQAPPPPLQPLALASHIYTSSHVCQPNSSQSRQNLHGTLMVNAETPRRPLRGPNPGPLEGPVPIMRIFDGRQDVCDATGCSFACPRCQPAPAPSQSRPASYENMANFGGSAEMPPSLQHHRRFPGGQQLRPRNERPPYGRSRKPIGSKMPVNNATTGSATISLPSSPIMSTGDDFLQSCPTMRSVHYEQQQQSSRHQHHRHHSRYDHRSSIQLRDQPTVDHSSRRRSTNSGSRLELADRNARQVMEPRGDDDSGEETDSGLSLVPSQAKGRLSMTVAEQMREQANNFVHQFGPADGKRSGKRDQTRAERHKPNLKVRRTLRVRIRKSKPILGIAIEGGFNVSGQLLPRIVCVHEDGAAYHCGKLRASDLILEVNGTPTANMTHEQIAKTIADAYYQDSSSHIEFLIGESVHV